MTEPFGYIGIDFGTSNSHFAYCNVNGDLTPDTIYLNGKPSVTTCILWKKNGQTSDTALSEKDILAYGNLALETWSQSSLEEQKELLFKFGFKPDIVTSETARQDAWGFLLQAKHAIDKANLPRAIGPGGMAVVVGIPAEVGEEHRKITLDIAQRAGLQALDCVEEPLGALALHLNRGDITPNEARGGVVVVDFGGGTLDIALVSSEGLQQPWGDPTLGGRIFDDLFFQWFKDQNPEVEIPEHEVMVVWQHECRELKENFSKRWRSQGEKMGDFKGQVYIDDQRFWLKEASVREFKKRATHYVPSQELLDYFQLIHKKPDFLKSETPINLFQEIEKTLRRAPNSHSALTPKSTLKPKSPNSSDVPSRDFSKVILTGGSSHWPFMESIICDIFRVEKEDIVASQHPETTIGSGLSLYYVLKQRNEKRREKLTEQLPELSQQFSEELEKIIISFAARCSRGIIDLIMPKIEDEFWHWYKKGGTLREVENNVAEICESMEPLLKRSIDTDKKYLDDKMINCFKKHLRRFLRENEIPKDVSYYVPDDHTNGNIPLPKGEHTSNQLVTDMRGLVTSATAATTGIAAVAIAAIELNVIVLAALSHPLIALVVGIGAIVTWLGLSGSAGKVVEKAVKDHKFNFMTLSFLKLSVSEKKFQQKLDMGRDDARRQLKEAILTSMSKIDISKEDDVPKKSHADKDSNPDKKRDTNKKGNSSLENDDIKINITKSRLPSQASPLPKEAISEPTESKDTRLASKSTETSLAKNSKVPQKSSEKEDNTPTKNIDLDDNRIFNLGVEKFETIIKLVIQDLGVLEQIREQKNSSS